VASRQADLVAELPPTLFRGSTDSTVDADLSAQMRADSATSRRERTGEIPNRRMALRLRFPRAAMSGRRDAVRMSSYAPPREPVHKARAR